MKKLFNVRDYMFDAADVQKLGQYVADQIGLYDGLTLMNRDEIKDPADNLVKAHPDYRFVIMADHKDQITSAFENGVLTCCEYEEG